MTSKTFQRHHAAIISGMVTAKFIRGVRMAMHHQWRKDKGYSIGQAYSGMSTAEVNQLYKMVRKAPPRVDAALTAKGLKFLQSARVQRQLDEFERCVVRHFSHFTMAGWYWDNGCQLYHPLYIVHGKGAPTNGVPFAFKYAAGSWQSGGFFETWECIA